MRDIPTQASVFRNSVFIPVVVTSPVVRTSVLVPVVLYNPRNYQKGFDYRAGINPGD
jgi:hypothetical protein